MSTARKKKNRSKEKKMGRRGATTGRLYDFRKDEQRQRDAFESDNDAEQVPKITANNQSEKEVPLKSKHNGRAGDNQ